MNEHETGCNAKIRALLHDLGFRVSCDNSDLWNHSEIEELQDIWFGGHTPLAITWKIARLSKARGEDTTLHHIQIALGLKED